MEVVRRNELTYRITHVQEDGTRQQYLANLVQVGDTRVLALFLDESADDDRLSNVREFVPDLFVQIGAMEPELRLRAVDYDDAADLLRTDREPDEKPDDDSTEGQFGVFHRL